MKYSDKFLQAPIQRINQITFFSNFLFFFWRLSIGCSNKEWVAFSAEFFATSEAYFWKRKPAFGSNIALGILLRLVQSLRVVPKTAKRVKLWVWKCLGSNPTGFFVTEFPIAIWIPDYLAPSPVDFNTCGLKFDVAFFFPYLALISIFAHRWHGYDHFSF